LTLFLHFLNVKKFNLIKTCVK